MSEDFGPDVPVSRYGAARKAAWLAHLEANAAASTAASIQDHRADSAILTASKQGIFGALSPQEQAAAVAARARRVGDDWGGRDLVARGGLDWESQGAGAVAPVPARADLRYVNLPGQQLGESPLARWLRERQ